MSLHHNSATLGFIPEETLEFSIDIHTQEEIYVSMKNHTTGVELTTAIEDYDLPELLKVVQAAILLTEQK